MDGLGGGVCRPSFAHPPPSFAHPPPSFPAPPSFRLPSSFPPSLPSFPRKRESTPRPIDTPAPTGVLDSGLRRNDGGECREWMGVGGAGAIPPTPFCERGAFWRRAVSGNDGGRRAAQSNGAGLGNPPPVSVFHCRPNPGGALRVGGARRLPGGGRRRCTSADRPGRARRRCRNTSAARPATPGRPPRRRWAGCPATPPASSAPPCR